MRYPKGYRNQIPAELEAEEARLTEMLRVIDRRFSCKPEPAPDATLVDEYNAAVAKYNAAVRPFNSCKEMISMDYSGRAVIK